MPIAKETTPETTPALTTSSAAPALGLSLGVHGTSRVHPGLGTTFGGGGDLRLSLGRAWVALGGGTATEAALALPDASGSAASELRILRVSALVAADRPGDALKEAEAVLAEPGVTRTEELHRFAAQLRLRAGDCEGARPHVDALSAAGALGAEVEERLEAGGCRP